MEKIYRYILTLCLVLGSGKLLFAQDPNFSMFYNNPTYYNPGMVAIGNGFTFRANTRNLWTPIPSKFNTLTASFEAEAVNKIGLGVQAYTDLAGEGSLRTSGANFQYMYRPVESKNFLLQMGFSAGFVNKFIDWSKLVFSDQLDEVHGVVRPSNFGTPNFSSVSYADFGAGLALKFNNRQKKKRKFNNKVTGTFGAGFHHLTTPKDAFLGASQRLPIKSVVHGNMNFLFGKIIFAPGVVYERQNKFETFTVGMNVINKPFFAGFWFRNQNYMMLPKKYDSFIVTTGIHFSPKRQTNYRIAYSFDMTMSRLRSSSVGTHEISFIIDYDDRVMFRKIRNQKRLREKYKCPEDFKGFD